MFSGVGVSVKVTVGVAVGVISPVGVGVAEADACGNSLAAVKVFALAMELSVKNAFVGLQIAYTRTITVIAVKM